MEVFKTIFGIFSKESPVKIALSGVISGVVYLFTPKTFKMLEKFGRFWYIIFWAAVAFLVISLLIYVRRRCIEIRNNRFVNEIRDKEFEENWLKVMQELKNKANKMSPNDRDLLRTFITTNNEPITRSSAEFYSANSLLGSDMVVSTVIKTAEKQELKVNRTNTKSIPIPIYETMSDDIQYKLKDFVYEGYKKLYESTGKISDFD